VGFFTPKVTKAQFSSEPVKAAAGAGRSQFNNLMAYSLGNAEEQALQNPTVSRSKDLLASMIGCLELRHYSKQWTGEKYEEIYLPLEPWMEQPDPHVTRNFFYSNLFSDLFFHGRAFAFVTSRYSTGLPASFEWLPASMVTTPNMAGPQWFKPAEIIQFNGQTISDTNDVIQFLSPIQGLLYQGARALSIATHLDQAADRYATLETVPGYLQQKGGETLDAEQLSEVAAAWSAARRQNAVGALNDYISFEEFKISPAETVAEQRKYQSLEMARVANIPAYLVSAPQEGSGLTYTNVQDSNRQLYLYGAKPFIECIQQTLSASNVLPRNRYVEFDVEGYIMEELMQDVMVEPVVQVPTDQGTPA
jgi:HK97 family phage portal protein